LQKCCIVSLIIYVACVFVEDQAKQQNINQFCCQYLSEQKYLVLNMFKAISSRKMLSPHFDSQWKELYFFAL